VWECETETVRIKEFPRLEQKKIEKRNKHVICCLGVFIAFKILIAKIFRYEIYNLLPAYF